MKQNTKFLWMYIGILFSFALILIVFAGLSVNTDTEQKQGLKDSIISLTEKNTELTNQVNALTAEKENLNQQIGSLYTEVTALKTSDEEFAAIETAISEALALYEAEKGKSNPSKEYETKLSAIDKTKLSQSQLYLYNMMMGTEE